MKSETHKTCRTPNPKVRSLIVDVSEVSFATAGGILPAAGTLYSDQTWKTFFGKDYFKEFKDFHYVCQMDDTREGGQLLFCMAGDTDASGAPLPFRSTTRIGNHYWHTILLELKPISVTGFPLATSVGAGGTNTNATRYVIREKYIPAATEGTRFVIDEFFSYQQFNIPKTPVPIASAVSYDFINRRGGFPECIHEKLVIPAVQTVTSGTLPEQIFPETNFTTWVPYVLSDDQELSQGGWYRKRVRVFPPALPDEIIRNA